MLSRRSPISAVAIVGCLALLLVLAPIPFVHANTSTACDHQLPHGVFPWGCADGVNGLGSATYDLFGIGGFLGPIPAALNVQSNVQYSLWF